MGCLGAGAAFHVVEQLPLERNVDPLCLCVCERVCVRVRMTVYVQVRRGSGGVCMCFLMLSFRRRSERVVPVVEGRRRCLLASGSVGWDSDEFRRIGSRRGEESCTGCFKLG